VSQLIIFFENVLCGAAAAVIFFPLEKLLPVNRICGALKCAALFADCSLLYCLFSLLFSFGSFRIYMLFGAAFGFLINFKSLSVILAFFRKMFYNRKKGDL